MKRHYRVFSRLIILFLLAISGNFLLFFNFPAKSQNQPAISVTTIYYPIQGATSAQLHAQMNRLGPLDPLTGRRFSAYTSWRVSWYYQTSRENNLCRLTVLQVTTDVTITLPRWIMPVKADRALADKWIKFISALMRHENGHKQHGAIASQRIAALIGENPPRPTCEEVVTLFTGQANAIVQIYSQEDIRYDRLTRHGITQGAILP